MRYYPIFLDLYGRRAVVVGGGRVAERKVRSLLRAGASVHVISPAVTPRLALLAAKKKIELSPRVYRKGDLVGSDSGRPILVFAATSHPEAQQAIRQEADALGALVNAANDPEQSSFLVPASFSQGELQVAISTSGASPAMARALRRQLQRTLGREYAAYLRLLRGARKQIMRTIPNQEHRVRAFRLLASALVDIPRATGARRAGSELTKLLRKFGAKVGVSR